MKKKNILIVLCVLLIVGLSFLFIFNRKGKNNKKEEKVFSHMEAGIVEEEVVSGLKFSNISMITDNGYTTFTCIVTNTNDQVSGAESVSIILEDNNGNEAFTLYGSIDKNLKPGESTTIVASAKGEFRNIKSKSFKIDDKTE